MENGNWKMVEENARTCVTDFTDLETWQVARRLPLLAFFNFQFPFSDFQFPFSFCP
jgi:hypothetical protein